MDKEAIKAHRERLRAHMLSAELDFSGPIVEWEGDEYEVRRPSVANRGAIVKAGKIIGGKGGKDEADLAGIQAAAVISLTVLPGTDIRVFDASDKARLIAQPCGGLFDALSKVATANMNVDTGEVRGNSEETPSASSDSG